MHLKPPGIFTHLDKKSFYYGVETKVALSLMYPTPRLLPCMLIAASVVHEALVLVGAVEPVSRVSLGAHALVASVGVPAEGVGVAVVQVQGALVVVATSGLCLTTLYKNNNTR